MNMKFNRCIKIFIYGIIFFSITCLTLFYYTFNKPNILINQTDKLLFIKKNEQLDHLIGQLKQEGYVNNIFTFRLLAYLLNYEKNILSGAYHLYPGMTNWEALQLLRTGKQEPINIVINQVTDKKDLAQKITKNLAIGADEFLQLMNDSTLLASYGFTTDNILTMFVPNTYNIYWNISATHLLKKMHQAYIAFWDSQRLEKAKKIGLSPIEVTILASIVAKETNNLMDAPKIAGVFINRLKTNQKLQSDPTVFHLMETPSAPKKFRLYRYIDSPYNTYMYEGLPPGPLTMPTISMIDAVLNYEQHNYLFFITHEDFSGNTRFARNFEEHKKNVVQYKKMQKLKSISK